MDDIQQTEGSENTKPSESGSELAMDDEEFGKSEEIYAMAKEIIAQEGDFKQTLINSEKRQKVLENQVTALRKNLASFVSPEIYNELREKYLETNMRLRAAFEEKLITADVEGRIKEVDVERNKTTQELRDELISVHKLLSEITIHHSARKKDRGDGKMIDKLENRIAELTVENETLKKSAEMARDETVIHRAIDSTVLAEFNELRQLILNLEANKEQDIKQTARISLELANYKVTEVGLREQKKLLENELLRMREELMEFRKHRESDGELGQLIGKEANAR
jgi:hypothetical protein